VYSNVTQGLGLLRIILNRAPDMVEWQAVVTTVMLHMGLD
jgi:hypothetical protein